MKKNQHRIQKPLRYVIEAGIIAAVYAALTILLAPISYGLIQVRVSEALCILPFFTSTAIPGLFIGCLLANVAGGLGVMDITVGSFATLLSAAIAYNIKIKWLVPLPSVIINAVAVGFILNYVLHTPLLESMAYVALGQAGACYVLGLPLLFTLNKYKKHIFIV